MTESKTTPNHNSKSYLPFDLESVAAFDSWKKLADEGLNRYVTWLDEMANVQKASFEQLTKAMDERSKVLNDSVAHAQKLTAEWHRMGIDSARRAAEMIKQ